jgi:hypothetical protein
VGSHVDHMPMRVSLFCARRERPRRSRTAEKRDENGVASFDNLGEREQVVGEITPSRTTITAADLLNDRVLPFFEEHDVKLLLTDRGTSSAATFQPLAVDDLDSPASTPYEVRDCSVCAATVTLDRRSPSISANRPWLNEMVSSLPCSLRTNSKRLKREVASCTELHNEVC